MCTKYSLASGQSNAHIFVRLQEQQTDFVDFWSQIAIEFNAGPLSNEPNDTSSNNASIFPLQADFVDQLFAEPFIKINLKNNVDGEFRLWGEMMCTHIALPHQIN